MVASFMSYGWSLDDEIISAHDDDVYRNETFLGVAVYKGLLTVTKYLLQCGANTNQYMNIIGFPETQMSLAAQLNDVDMSRLLRKYGGRVHGNMAIHCAASKGSMQAINWLVSEGAQIGEVVRTGDYMTLLEEGEAAGGRVIYRSGTALHNAASGGSIVAARYLLERGVRKDSTNSQGGDSGIPRRESRRDRSSSLPQRVEVLLRLLSTSRRPMLRCRIT